MNRFKCLLPLGLAAFAASLTGNSAAAGSAAIPLLAQAAKPGTEQAAPTPQQRAAIIKQWLQASQVQLRNYEWIETTVVSKGGEEKSRKQNTCYYGVDGKLQKVPVAGGTEEKAGGPPGIMIPGKILKKIGEKKQAELAAYMQSAIALIHSYMPPDPNRLQTAVGSGKLSVNMLQPGRRVQLVLRDYLKPNDSLSIDIELPTNRVIGMHVTSYVDKPDDVVQLDVTMGVLPDGTIFAQKTLLNAQSKDITVTVDNSGHHRTAG